MQVVTHELFRGCEDAFNLQLKSSFHVPTSLNIYNGSQPECDFFGRIHVTVLDSLDQGEENVA